MALTLLPPAPDPYNDTPTEFGAKAATFVKAQQDMVPELNAMLASLDSVAAGGALSIPYTFSTILTDSDPGAGKLRLNTTGQSSATVIRCDLLSSNGEDLAAVLDQFATSTSATKGDIRLVKSGDVTKWLSFKLTAAASPAGYRNFTVTYVGGSSASPFVDGDGLVLFFTRNGDKGDQGPSGTPEAFPYMKVSDRKASGTHGGNSVGITITQTRTLNTVEANSIPGASLASNSVTLPTGTYDFRGRAPALNASAHKAFLYNATAGAYAGIGSNSFANDNSTTTDSVLTGRFTIAASSAFNIRHYINLGSTNGLGAAISSGQPEVYSELEFWKVG